MSSYSFGYRARLWLLQNLTRMGPSSTQYEDLEQLSWDALIILDACRYDTLSEVTPWPINHTRSPASSTEEWISKMRRTDLFEGTHIVAGNVNYANFDLNFESIHHVWDTKWNHRLGIVPPEPTLDQAAKLLDETDDPVIAHVMPPHAPYIGKAGDTWVPLMPDADIWQSKGPDSDVRKMSAGEAMAKGAVDIDKAKRSYRCSVNSTWETVLAYVSDWLSAGREVVVTADHGETFGRAREGFMYAHPSKCHIQPLVRVPLVHLTPSQNAAHTPDSVEEKLQALGYVTE